MEGFRVSEDIVAFGEFKAQASKVMRKLKEGKRPVVITQHGKPAAVLVTPGEFDQWREHRRFLNAVQVGLDDVKAGRVVEGQVFSLELKRRFQRKKRA